MPGGIVVEDGRCLRTAVLRPLSGREEEWLARHTDAPNAARVSWLLNACLRTLDGEPVVEQMADRLLLADRDYLVLQLRQLTFGDGIMAVFTCPACVSRMDVDLEVGDVPVLFRPQQSSSYTLELSGESGTRTVLFRLPTGKDMDCILRADAGTAPELDLDQAADALLDRCLLSDGGQPLSVEERCVVGDAMAERAPEVELELELACPECGHIFITPFDTTAFFLEELRVRGDQLLREVHTLAGFYHWSEAEILDLQRDRRRAYLHLVSEATRVD